MSYYSPWFTSNRPSSNQYKGKDAEGAITPAPGQSPDACMVLSKTGKHPHYVKPKQNGGFACDGECPQYRYSGICSHVVAAAEDTGKLSNLVISLQKNERVPNITKLATATELNPLSPVTSSRESVQVNVSSGIDQSSSSHSSSAVLKFV